MIRKVVDHVKTFSPKAVKANWKSIDARKALVEELSEHTGLKKIYFECLPEAQLQSQVETMKLAKKNNAFFEKVANEVGKNNNRA